MNAGRILAYILVHTLRTNMGHSIISNWRTGNHHNEIWESYYIPKPSDYCYQTWLGCQNHNRNGTNCWTSLVWHFYGILMICNWHITFYLTICDHCSIMFYFTSFFIIMLVYLFITHLTVLKTCTINCYLITNCRLQWKCSKLSCALTLVRQEVLQYLHSPR